MGVCEEHASCSDVRSCRRFKPSEGVIVIAATNFPESLDKALIRPGRFDRRVAWVGKRGRG